jgi:hypothetical protein
MQLEAEIRWTPSVRKLQNWSSLFLTEKFKLEQQESEIVTDLDRSWFDLELVIITRESICCEHYMI